MSSLIRQGGRTSRSGHARAARRQDAPDPSFAGTSYQDAADWPAWTDRVTFAPDRDATDWPGWTDRVTFATGPEPLPLFDGRPPYEKGE